MVILVLLALAASSVATPVYGTDNGTDNTVVRYGKGVMPCPTGLARKSSGYPTVFQLGSGAVYYIPRNNTTTTPNTLSGLLALTTQSGQIQSDYPVYLRGSK